MTDYFIKRVDMINGNKVTNSLTCSKLDAERYYGITVEALLGQGFEAKEVSPGQVFLKKGTHESRLMIRPAHR